MNCSLSVNDEQQSSPQFGTSKINEYKVTSKRDTWRFLEKKRSG